MLLVSMSVQASSLCWVHADPRDQRLGHGSIKVHLAAVSTIGQDSLSGCAFERS